MNEVTLDEAVAEVIGYLEGIDLQLVPEQDRYQSIVRQINRALRAVALEQEWSFYSDLEMVGHIDRYAHEMTLRRGIRPRMIGDDAVQIKLPGSHRTVEWAYFLPRDALHKYSPRDGLRVAYANRVLTFNRKFLPVEFGREIHVPVMREPKQFKLPPYGETVPMTLREMLVDFEYPDLVLMKAAYFYAQTDPIMQPRIQNLDENYKNLMYALTERDARATDVPYQNDWSLGIQSGISGQSDHPFGRPVADQRGYHGRI